jgi:tetratricopeptide (TPR) repeat protein
MVSVAALAALTSIALLSAASAQTAPPAARLQRPYSPPPNYDQLRADCASDADVARQIAGCEAVLANPGEQTNYAIAYNNRGHAQERAGNTAAALADYERAIKQEPTYATAHINRARVLAQLGRTDEAIAALDAAIKIENDAWARYDRARLLAAKGDRVRALADLEEAVRLAPGEAEIRTERDRVRALQAAQAPPAAPTPTPAHNPLEAAVLGAGRSYVGEALLRAPLGPLPAGDALGTYTRDLLAPGFPGLALSPLSASSPLAFKAETPGLPGLMVLWQDLLGADAARTRMSQFERELNGSCNDNRVLAQRSGEGARVAVHATTCPTVAPPYQLLWLSASDRERTRLLLVAGPLAQSAAILAAGDRVIAALGMTREGTVTAAPSPSEPQAAHHAPTPASPMGLPIDAAEAFASRYGQRLVDEFASVLRDSADPACVAAAGSRGPTRARAEQWLVRYGQRMIDLERRSTSPSAFDDAIDKLEGTGSAARFRKFLERPEMRDLLHRARPLRVAGVGDRVIQYLGRHLIIHRVRLARQFVPIEIGDSITNELEAILKPVNDELDAAEARGSDFAQFAGIVVMLPIAETNLVGPDVPLLQSFEGIVTELREACLHR